MYLRRLEENEYIMSREVFSMTIVIYSLYAQLTIDWQTSTGQMRTGKENNVKARKFMEYICQFWTENSEFGLV